MSLLLFGLCCNAPRCSVAPPLLQPRTTNTLWMSTDALLQTICIDYFYLAAGVLFLLAGAVSSIHSDFLNHTGQNGVSAASTVYAMWMLTEQAGMLVTSNKCAIQIIRCQFHLELSFCTFMQTQCCQFECKAEPIFQVAKLCFGESAANRSQKFPLRVVLHRLPWVSLDLTQ